MWRLLLARRETADLAIIARGVCGLTLLFGLYLYDDDALFAPFTRIIDMMLIARASSSSSAERGARNIQALQALVETWRFGVGIGSTRASSSIVAALAGLITNATVGDNADPGVMFCVAVTALIAISHIVAPR
ncbi:MAG: hypothetical protein R3D67_15045 [Hyphomicrobiaceae bacterium]